MNSMGVMQVEGRDNVSFCIIFGLYTCFSNCEILKDQGYFYSDSPFLYIILNAGDTKHIFIDKLYRENNKFDKTVLSIKLYHEV